MKKTRTTDATVEPVTAAEMEEQLSISSGWNATKVARNIKAARQMVELETDRSLITQTWKLNLNDWPFNEVIFLPNGVTQSVTSVKYYDTAGSQQTLVADTDYEVSINGDIATIRPLLSWPALESDKIDSIEVIYVTGYGDAAANVPDWAKEAVISMATELYELGQVDMSKIYQSLIVPHKLYFDYASND